jgi:hypothetical protein
MKTFCNQLVLLTRLREDFGKPWGNLCRNIWGPLRRSRLHKSFPEASRSLPEGLPKSSRRLAEVFSKASSGSCGESLLEASPQIVPQASSEGSKWFSGICKKVAKTLILQENFGPIWSNDLNNVLFRFRFSKLWGTNKISVKYRVEFCVSFRKSRSRNAF